MKSELSTYLKSSRTSFFVASKGRFFTIILVVLLFADAPPLPLVPLSQRT